MAGGGRGKDDVTTHLLVALYKARRGRGGGGIKRRSNRYCYHFVEQGGGPCCPLTQTAPDPPALMRSVRKKCQHAGGVRGNDIHLPSHSRLDQQAW